jgi:hypothetical protein
MTQEFRHEGIRQYNPRQREFKEEITRFLENERISPFFSLPALGHVVQRKN